MNHRPLYLRPDYREVAEAAGHNQAELAVLQQFADRGYVILDLDMPDFERIAEATKAALDPEYAEDGRIQDAWLRHEGPKAIATSERILSTLKLLYGRTPFPFQTLNFNKGTEQETHSDTIHFDSHPQGFMAGVWVALEDIDANNGPLHYFPGSHRLPHLTLADAGARGSVDGAQSYNTHYLPLMQEVMQRHGFTREEAYIRKGQAVIWSANLSHGGSPIREAGRSRHSQVTHYYFDDCAYYTPLMSDPLLGIMDVRSPYDIRTGERRPGSYAGGTIAPPKPPGLLRRLATRVLDRLDG